jgi:hypothetical protein
MSCSETNNGKILVAPNRLSYPSALGKLGVMYKDREFYVIDQQNCATQIQRCFLSKEIRSFSLQQLEKLSQVASFSLKKVDDVFTLRCQSSLLGGGLGALAGKVVTCVWEFGKHRTGIQWLAQATHRTIGQWWNQGGHRTIIQWLSGIARS